MKKAIAYQEAAARAAESRARLLSSANAMKARISPARLKSDAKAKIVGSLYGLADRARERPVAAGAGAAALLLYLFRRPVGALFGRLYVRIRDRNSENSETDDG